jgi:predicted lipoprotein
LRQEGKIFNFSWGQIGGDLNFEITFTSNSVTYVSGFDGRVVKVKRGSASNYFRTDILGGQASYRMEIGKGFLDWEVFTG